MNERNNLDRATMGGGSGGARAFFGVPALDDLLPVGMSTDTQIMVVGDTGVGKTVLAAQFLYEGLLVGDRCIYVACDEPPASMRNNMANLRLGSVAYEQAGQLVFVDAYARERSKEWLSVPDPGDLDEYFSYEREAVEHFGHARTRLVVDSMSTLFGTVDRNTVLEFNRSRLRYLASRGVLTLDNYVVGLLDAQTMSGLSHAYPLMVKLGYVTTDGTMQRVLQLGKLRSGMFSGERRAFRIDARTGIVAQR